MPHNLAPGHPGPPPPHRPRVPAGEPLPAAATAGGPTGVHPVRRSAAIQDFPRRVRPIPGLSRPPPPLPSPLAGPGCTRRAQGAGSTGRRQAERGGEDRPRRGARSSCSRGAPPPSRPENAEMAAAAAKGRAGSPAPLGAPVPPATSRRRRRQRRRRRSGRWVNRRPQPWSWAAGWPRPLPTRRDEGAGPLAPNHSAPPARPAQRLPHWALTVGRPQEASVTREVALQELRPAERCLQGSSSLRSRATVVHSPDSILLSRLLSWNAQISLPWKGL